MQSWKGRIRLVRECSSREREARPFGACGGCLGFEGFVFSVWYDLIVSLLLNLALDVRESCERRMGSRDEGVGEPPRRRRVPRSYRNSEPFGNCWRQSL